VRILVRGLQERRTRIYAQDTARTLRATEQRQVHTFEMDCLCGNGSVLHTCDAPEKYPMKGIREHHEKRKGRKTNRDGVLYHRTRSFVFRAFEPVNKYTTKQKIYGTLMLKLDRHAYA
jgi:hypothetical protein